MAAVLVNLRLYTSSTLAAAKAKINLKFGKNKKSKFCFYRLLNLKVLKFYFQNFCYCEFEARFPKTS